MAHERAESRRPPGVWLLGWAARVVAHGLAIVLLFAGLAAAFGNGHVWEVLVRGMREPAVADDLLRQAALLLGLTACFWALLVIAWHWLRLGLREARRDRIVRVRGTVLTETLIVLPVFLLLTFGLAQMGINSIAGLLTTLGCFEAGRTVAVWAPEVGHNRSGRGRVTEAMVIEKARTAAAGVIAPVVPMGESGLQGCDALPEGVTTHTVERLIEAMADPSMTLSADVTPESDRSSFISAFDVSTFANRGPTKLMLAFCATDVDFDRAAYSSNPAETGRPEVWTSVTYHHPMALPLVGMVFGYDPGNGRWDTPFVAQYKRVYRLHQQLTPNPELP